MNYLKRVSESVGLGNVWLGALLLAGGLIAWSMLIGIAVGFWIEL